MKKAIVLLLMLAMTSMAMATYDFYGPGRGTAYSNDWFTAANWNSGVPTIAATGATGVRMYGGSAYNNSELNAAVINSGNARAVEVRVGSGAPALETAAWLVMNGGTLKTTNWLMLGADSATNGGRAGIFKMTGGTVTLGGATADGLDTGGRTTGHLFVGHGTGTLSPYGKLIMSGGSIDVGGDFAIGKNYTHGIAELSGTALITANNFLMRPDNAAATAQLTISGMAKIIVNGNQFDKIVGYQDAGWINPDAGIFYNSTTNKTIITPEPISMLLLGLGGLLIRRK